MHKILLISFFAYGGNDTIFSTPATTWEQRANIIYAGDGNDTVVGSAGDDQYIFERGNGIDQLSDTGGIDTLVMGPSVAADDVIFEVVPTDQLGNSDLYIGIRDRANPNLTASQVGDRVQVVGGGTLFIDINGGAQTRNSIDFIRAGGQEIDLNVANINWTKVQYSTGSGPYPPVVLDLDGDGVELRSVDGSRISVVEQDGSITRLGWVGPDDGFLALDRNRDGAIDRVDEICFVEDAVGAKTDLEGLAAYDTNANGLLDNADKRWAEFQVWRDKDQDGRSNKGELLSLDEAGVRSISLKGEATGFTASDSLDHVVLATSAVQWTDPARTGSAYDVVLGALQVRADKGGKNAADVSARAFGNSGSDPLDANLYGVQALADL